MQVLFETLEETYIVKHIVKGDEHSCRVSLEVQSFLDDDTLAPAEKVDLLYTDSTKYLQVLCSNRVKPLAKSCMHEIKGRVPPTGLRAQTLQLKLRVPPTSLEWDRIQAIKAARNAERIQRQQEERR